MESSRSSPATNLSSLMIFIIIFFMTIIDTSSGEVLTLYDHLALVNLEEDFDACRMGAQAMRTSKACSNVEVAVTHKKPWCATVIVISFLISVVVGIFLCSQQMENGRRLTHLRGGDAAWLD